MAKLQDALSAGAAVPAKATGVYIGCVWQEYQLRLEQLQVPTSVHILTGSGLNFLIGRISFTFGFQGLLRCLSAFRVSSPFIPAGLPDSRA